MQPENNGDMTGFSGSRSPEIYKRIAEALAKVGVCVRSAGLYGRFHTVVEESAQEAHLDLEQLLILQPAVIVAVTESCLVLDGFPVEDPSGCLAAFAKLLWDRSVGELKLSSGISKEEVIEFSEILSLPPEDTQIRGGIIAELQRRNVQHIRTQGTSMPTQSRQGRDAADIYEEALLLVEEAMRAVQTGLQLPSTEIRAVVADSLHCLVGDDSALLALAGIRSYDRYLSEHSVNVCILSMVLGKDIGLMPGTMLELGIAAMLHDVGKVFVPSGVVKKPGKLTEDEWQQIRRHPADGARALAGLPDLPALTSTIALEHHIHCDGSGYPALDGQHSSHLLSRLVAVADTFDALTTDRPYRKRWTPEEAIGYMLYDAYRQYDRQLIARFAARAKLCPIGSLVKLRDGRMAVVVGGSHANPTKPLIKLIDGNGTTADGLVDLSTCTDPGIEIETMAQPVELLFPYTEKLLVA